MIAFPTRTATSWRPPVSPCSPPWAPTVSRRWPRSGICSTREELKLSLNETRQKTKNLLANPKVTMLFVDPTNPYRTLEVRATAECDYDDDRALAGKVGNNYRADLSKMDQPGERRLTVTLRPARINTNG